VCANELGASWERQARAGENSCDDFEKMALWHQTVIVESGDGVLSDGYEGKSPGSDSCDAHVLASLVGMAQTTTTLSKVRDEDSSSILSFAAGLAWLRDHGEWFATCALGVVAVDAYFCEAVDSVVPPEKNWCCRVLLSDATSREPGHSEMAYTTRDFGRRRRSIVATWDDALPSRAVMNADLYFPQISSSYASHLTYASL
jgi:hypothetical protein